MNTHKRFITTDQHTELVESLKAWPEITVRRDLNAPANEYAYAIEGPSSLHLTINLAVEAYNNDALA